MRDFYTFYLSIPILPSSAHLYMIVRGNGAIVNAIRRLNLFGTFHIRHIVSSIYTHMCTYVCVCILQHAFIGTMYTRVHTCVYFATCTHGHHVHTAYELYVYTFTICFRSNLFSEEILPSLLNPLYAMNKHQLHISVIPQDLVSMFA